jgi:hypothetical protein
LKEDDNVGFGHEGYWKVGVSLFIFNILEIQHAFAVNLPGRAGCD